MRTGRPKGYTAADEARFRELIGYGMTDREISKVTGFSWKQIFYFRKLNGIPSNKHPYLRPELDELLRELHAAGYSIQQIAEESGIGPFSVRTWLKARGLEANHRRRGGNQKRL